MATIQDATTFSQFLAAYKECDSDMQAVVDEMAAIAASKDADDDDRSVAADVIIEALFPGLSEDISTRFKEIANRPGTIEIREEIAEEEASFAENLRSAMESKGVNQVQLSELTGVSQPSISNILNRNCRPQQRTVKRFSEALGVDESTLWP